MLPYLRVFCLICVISLTKVGNTKAKSVRETNAADSEGAATPSKLKPKVSNYFRHDPYGPNTYAFGYEIEDPSTGNIQFRDERRYVNGSIEGSFGYVRPDGLITVTRFRAGNETGYLSQTQTFDAGDEINFQAHWPTQKPSVIAERTPTAGAGDDASVVWDTKNHLNVTATEVADDVANKLKQETGIDLNHISLEEDLLQPALLDIVNGKVPLKKTVPNGGLGFEPVHNFIPQDFSIVPFKLPADEEPADKASEKQEGEGEEEKAEGSKNELEAADKNEEDTKTRYDKAKANNDEKSPQTEEQRKQSSTPPTPEPLVTSSGAGGTLTGSAWYEKIIADNRREFLEQLPQLN